MLKTAIHDQHVSLNAKFRDGDEWALPASYGSVEKEVVSVRKGIGLIDLSSRGKLRLTGKDHLRLLQGMLSNDVMKLENGRGVYATLLTVKGKVMSDMRVYKGKDYALMDLEQGMNKTIRDHLVKYKLSYKAEIEDISFDYSLFHICGPGAAEFLEDLYGFRAGDLNNLEFAELGSDDRKIILISVNRTGESGFDLMVTNRIANELWSKIIEKGKDAGLTPFGADSLEVMRVEAGIPVYGSDFDDSTIPIEAGLWNALSFEKGCFIGQEVVARIKWRGRVNWHLVTIQIESDKLPARNDAIYNDSGKKIGRITSPVYSYQLKSPISLAYLRREYVEPGTKIHVQSGDISMEASVISPPVKT